MVGFSDWQLGKPAKRDQDPGTTGVEAGDEIGLHWDAPAGPPIAPEIAGGAAALLVLLVGSWFAFRSRGRGDAGSATSPAAG